MKQTLLATAASITALWASAALAAPVPIDMTQACNQGGTRLVKGSFDAASGAVDLKVTLTACAGRPSDKPLVLPVPVPAVPASGASAPTTTSGNAADSSRSGKAYLRGIATHDGTITIKGTFLNTDGLVTVNLVDQIDTKVTFDPSAKSMARVCTIARIGTLDARKDAFEGTVTHNNCTMTGSYHESFGLIEHLLRHTTDTNGH